MDKLLETLKEWQLDGELKQLNVTSWRVADNYVIKEYHDVSMLKRNTEMFKVLPKLP